MNAANAESPDTLRVRVSRFIRAPRRRIFDAWLDPEIRRKWWFTDRGSGLTACEIDARVGGRYCLKQIGSDSPTPGVDDDFEWIMQGEFLEIDAPQRLVFTWNVNHPGEPITDERVTVEFNEAKGGTEVVITHEGILSTQMRDGTEEGWTKLLELLEPVVAEK